MENMCLELKYDQIADVLGNAGPSFLCLLCVSFLCGSMLELGAAICSLLAISKMSRGLKVGKWRREKLEVARRENDSANSLTSSFP